MNNSIIKTGICSYGMSGKLFHAPFIQNHPGFELTAIVERSKNESGEKYPASRLCRSVDELIADESLQLIIVNTPVQTHFEYAKKALAAGKHVIVEKPFTVTSKEAEELVALAAENNVMLFVYQNRRYDGDYKMVKEVLENKLLGEIKEVEIRYDRYRPEISYKVHKETDLPGAGTTYDLGAHLIDQSLQLFGQPHSLFADMMAMRDGSPVDDYFEIILYYPSFRVRLKGTCFAKEPVPEYILNGAKGTFLQKRSDLQETQLLKGVTPTIETWCPAPEEPDGFLNIVADGKEIKEKRLSTPGNYMNYFTDIYKAIHKMTPNPVPGTDGVRIIHIIEAAKQSAKEGRIINVQ
ncbi:Gfo/Idh/MocA family oxidoreductase [Terrimonas pollutisoli]|uniref:Gfo/Idh/MocA family oxidoreductase n=1 Tax=Terrimonas pollutisoli TaxID=3034147 RepID=UPI0023EC1114|nr:Gfo/Idh/MocA family oxidoreductase [Terrimonas sp. H1YJ31]